MPTRAVKKGENGYRGRGIFGTRVMTQISYHGPTPVLSPRDNLGPPFPSHENMHMLQTEQSMLSVDISRYFRIWI